METIKIKRRLHKTDLSLLEYKIGSLERNLKSLRKNLNEPKLDLDEINQIYLGLQHGVYDLLQRTIGAINSIGKEMK